MPASSSSSTELAGFRIERVLGRGPRGTVYAATQPGLERRVALKVIPAARFRPDLWPEHERVVTLFAAGECARGRYAAMRLISGPRLADLPADAARRVLADVAEALDGAHAAGLVHGAVSAGNVLVDGDRGLLSDFGFAADDATPQSDRRAFAALVAERLGGEPAPNPRTAAEVVTAAPPAGAPRRRRLGPRGRGAAPARFAAWGLGRRALALAAALLTVAAAIVGAVFPRGDRPPPVPPGVQPLGSALAAAGVRSLDCDGRPPGGASPGCTLLQAVLPGRRLLAPRDGAISGWAVRGAQGELALQVVRGRGGRYATVGSSQYERVVDAGLHVLRANLAIRAGDRVAVELAPGAAIGMRAGVTGAGAARFTGALRTGLRRPDAGGLGAEVLLRVDYVPGRAPRRPARLTGAAAARAPGGRRLDQRDVELPGGTVRTVAVVALPGRVAVDLFRGGVRLGRVAVPDADPRGRLEALALSGEAQGRPSPLVRWRNPDGRVVAHGYRVAAGSLSDPDGA